MKKLISIFVILILAQETFAQFMGGMGGGSAPKIYDGKITGVVRDSLYRQPVNFGTVSLFEKGSSKPLDGTMTDDKGSFKFKNLKNGKYFIILHSNCTSIKTHVNL